MIINIQIKSLSSNCLLLLILLLFSPFQASKADNIIGPDDALRITVYGYEDLRTETRVSTDGKITFPLIGEIAANGKSSIELEKIIATRLKAEGFIHDAQVTVAVLEHVSQQVSVLGYVNKPGRYPLESNSSVLDLLAMAGGIQELGDTKAVVTRTINGISEKQELDLHVYMDSKNPAIPIKLMQGDVVYIPKAPMFYIYGEVQHPGGYRLEPNFSVVKAITVGGGLTLRASKGNIVIKRPDEQGLLQEIDVDLNSPVLNEDVIYVGERWF